MRQEKAFAGLLRVADSPRTAPLRGAAREQAGVFRPCVHALPGRCGASTLRSNCYGGSQSALQNGTLLAASISLMKEANWERKLFLPLETRPSGRHAGCAATTVVALPAFDTPIAVPPEGFQRRAGPEGFRPQRVWRLAPAAAKSVNSED